MTPEDFRNWRKTMKLTKRAAAALLGVGATTVDQYETGIRRGSGESFQIPHTVALACSALIFGLPAYPEMPKNPAEEARAEDQVAA